MTHDAFDEPTSTGDLGSLLVMAKELVAVEREVKDLEALLKQRNGRANELKTQLLPDKMAEVGLSEFKTPEGDRLKLKTSFPVHCRRRLKNEPRRLRRWSRWAVQGSFAMSYLWRSQSRSTTKHWHWLPSFAKRGLMLRYRQGFIRKPIS